MQNPKAFLIKLGFSGKGIWRKRRLIGCVSQVGKRYNSERWQSFWTSLPAASSEVSTGANFYNL